MPKRYKVETKQKEKVRVVPNFGFILVLDMELQKQIEDLNDMKNLSTANKEVQKVIDKPK